MATINKIFVGTTPAESAAIWENADAIVKAWHAEYTEILNTPDVDFNEYPTREGEFSKAYYANSQRKEFAHTPENLRPTRTTESLEGWKDSAYFDKKYELDLYGGWKNEEDWTEFTVDGVHATDLGFYMFAKMLTPKVAKVLDK